MGLVTARARSDPSLIHHSRGVPNIVLGSRGHPHEKRNTRDGPPEYLARGKPHEILVIRDVSMSEAISRGNPLESRKGRDGPHGRGMPCREMRREEERGRPENGRKWEDGRGMPGWDKRTNLRSCEMAMGTRNLTGFGNLSGLEITAGVPKPRLRRAGIPIAIGTG